MFIEITSKNNGVFKHIKSLSIKSHREKNNEFIIEGLRLVKDALDSKAGFKMVAVNESFLNNIESDDILQLFQKDNIRIFKLADKLFKEISHTGTPQGILGVVSIENFSIDKLPKRGENYFYVFCDSVQDPGNMGTIIRTADAAGADAVIISKGCVDIYNPKTVRSTMGSLFHLPIIKIGDTKQFLLSLKNTGVQIISGDLSASKYHFNIDMKQDLMLVIGNEANGISDPIKELSDYPIKIPIVGKAESLNASIASAILMYEVVRQRMI